MSIGSVKMDRDYLELVDDGRIKSSIANSDECRISEVTGHGHSEDAEIPAVKPRITKAINLWEIILFAIICTADMVSTVYWYTHGNALEANPALAFWLNKSVTAFCIAKIATFGPLLIVCAVFRERYARVITPGLRIAMATYVIIYISSVTAQLL